MGTPEKKRDLGKVAQQLGVSGSESSEGQQWLGVLCPGLFYLWLQMLIAASWDMKSKQASNG